MPDAAVLLLVRSAKRERELGVRRALRGALSDLGFDPSGVVLGLMGLREASYPEASDRVEAFSRLSDRIDARAAASDPMGVLREE